MHHHALPSPAENEKKASFQISLIIMTSSGTPVSDFEGDSFPWALVAYQRRMDSIHPLTKYQQRKVDKFSTKGEGL